MRSVAALKHEHELVRKLLRCLGAVALDARVTGVLDRRVAGRVLYLLERFVDWVHQDKEELQLFPSLLARATADESRELDRLFGEHGEERRRLVGMYAHMHGAIQGRPTSLDRFVRNALLYERLQTRHLQSEEEFVLPLAEAILTPEDDRRILHGFAEIDGRLGTIRRLETRIEALSRRLGVAENGTRARVGQEAGA